MYVRERPCKPNVGNRFVSLNSYKTSTYCIDIFNLNAKVKTLFILMNLNRYY